MTWISETLVLEAFFPGLVIMVAWQSDKSSDCTKSRIVRMRSWHKSIHFLYTLLLVMPSITVYISMLLCLSARNLLCYTAIVSLLMKSFNMATSFFCFGFTIAFEGSKIMSIFFLSPLEGVMNSAIFCPGRYAHINKYLCLTSSVWDSSNSHLSLSCTCVFHTTYLQYCPMFSVQSIFGQLHHSMVACWCTWFEGQCLEFSPPFKTVNHGLNVCELWARKTSYICTEIL